MKKPRTLIVDDDPAIRDILSVILQRDGWDVLCAADGEEAVQRISEEKFDIIVLDLLMPRMNGAEVLNFMAEHNDKTPVVVVSGAASEHHQTLDSRIVRVTLKKPFEIGDLRAVLRAILDTADHHLR